jgi:hypothetical protein
MFRACSCSHYRAISSVAHMDIGNTGFTACQRSAYVPDKRVKQMIDVTVSCHLVIRSNTIIMFDQQAISIAKPNGRPQELSPSSTFLKNPFPSKR